VRFSRATHLIATAGLSVSIRKISSVINEAALTAKRWNDSIDLSTIKTGANDEIFQGHSPVLVGVDPLTTYTYLLNSAKRRDATTWGTYLLEKEKFHDALIIKAGEIHIALKKTELENDSLKEANQYLDSQIRAERQQKDQLEKERNEKEQELQRYKRENEEAQRQIAATVNSIMIPKQVLGGMALILGLAPLLYQKFW